MLINTKYLERRMTYLKYLGHSSLLALRAMIFDGENDRVRGTDESASVNRFYDRAKRYLGSESVTVVNNRGSIIAVPAIEFNTSASCQ